MSVGTYSLAREGDKLLSPHFRVREFACRDGSDPIFVEEELAALLHGKIFDGLHRRSLVLWGYRMERIFLPAPEWNAAGGEIRLSFLGGMPAKIQTDHARHRLTICIKKSNP